jgi:hypothetical protein
MSSLRAGEWERFESTFPGGTFQPFASGVILVRTGSLALPPGWSKAETIVRFLVPIGYPAAQPDCFWADADLTLAGGSPPASSAIQQIPETGEPVLWFSWHPQTWQPSKDDLISYGHFALARLHDVR